MGNRTLVAMGSALGALALHVVMVACGSSGSTSSPGDGGMFADVRDAIVDAVGDVLDAETGDARADDGGTQPACNCVEPPSYRFSGAMVNQGAGDVSPEVDHSTALITGIAGRSADGSTVISTTTTLGFYLRDGTRFYAQCSVAVRPDRSIVRGMGSTGLRDGACIAQVSGGDAGIVTDRDVVLNGVTVEELANDRIVLRFPVFRVTRDGTTAIATVGETIVRATVPGASMITPSRAYRP